MSHYDPLDLRGQTAAKDAAGREKKLSQEQLSDDLQWLMADPRGRRLMRGWMAFCGADRVPFAGHADQTNFACGMQNVGLMLRSQLTTHAMEGYLQMLREHVQGDEKGSAHIEG